MENSSFRRIYFLHVNFSDFKFSQIIAFVFRLYTAVFHTFYAFYRFYPPFHTFCILLVKSQLMSSCCNSAIFAERASADVGFTVLIAISRFSLSLFK